MIYIKKIFKEGDKVMYFYQPESKGKFGEIVFDYIKEEIESIQNAEEGIDNGDFYIRHVVKRLVEYKKSNNFKDEDVIE